MKQPIKLSKELIALHDFMNKMKAAGFEASAELAKQMVLNEVKMLELEQQQKKVS